jgi:hypothetical protein
MHVEYIILLEVFYKKDSFSIEKKCMNLFSIFTVIYFPNIIDILLLYLQQGKLTEALDILLTLEKQTRTVSSLS